MSSDDRLIATRYARALFDLAQEQNKQDEAKEDLLTIKSVLAESLVLGKFLENPVVTRVQAQQGIEAVLTALKTRPLVRRFFFLLARERRLSLAKVIIDAYLAFLAESRGELSVRVTSAQNLSESQLGHLIEALVKATGRKIDVHVNQDDALLGGLRVQIGSRMLDTSLASKLEQLKRTMAEAA